MLSSIVSQSLSRRNIHYSWVIAAVTFLTMLPFTDFTVFGLSIFAVMYGLDWIATVPPTIKLTVARFGPERANIVFGWIFTGHQLGAAFAAYGAGLTRTLLATYMPSFFIAGLLCIIAALISLAIAKPARSSGPAMAGS